MVNFAHGSLFMLGAYVAWSVLAHLPRTPAGFCARHRRRPRSALAALGALLEVALLRRLYRAPELLQLLATFGVVLIVQDVTQAIWGAEDLALPRPHWMRAFVRFGDERFPLYDLVLIAAGPLVLGALWLLLHRTRLGHAGARGDRGPRHGGRPRRRSARAVHRRVRARRGARRARRRAVAARRIRPICSWTLPTITDAFVVVVVGGLGSLGGAYLASLLIGVLQAFGIVLLPKLTLVLVFAVMAVVLVVRPQGLLGRPGAARARGRGAAARAAGAAGPVACSGWCCWSHSPPRRCCVGPFAISVLTEAMIAVLFAASLHFMMGPGGMPSFGHAAWFGIGAYAAALTTSALAWPLPFALLAPCSRRGPWRRRSGGSSCGLSGVYLAMLTLAFAQIVWAVALQWSDVTGGDNGILGALAARLRSPTRASSTGWRSRFAPAGALLLRRILYAPFGYALRAARDFAAARRGDRPAGHSALRLAAFAIAGAAAGLAGGADRLQQGQRVPGDDLASAARSMRC